MSEDETSIWHVEIIQKEESSLNAKVIEEEVRKFIFDQNEITPGIYTGSVLSEHVCSFRICSDSDEKRNLRLDSSNIEIKYYVYQNCSTLPQYNNLDEASDEAPISLNWALPNAEFEGLWESLVLENDLKTKLINYMQTALLYSKSQVSSQIIRWNGVVLLHGPPGTGKTSLCKALAQKLSIRLNNKYFGGQLIEINTHSLFSKWFSESPKLVFKMFNTIKEWLEFEEHFTCILIDEVESLTHSRNVSGMEPTDSIRVVNTVLTQLDQLQRYNNVLILATSNVSDAIDIAFADRADLKLYLGHPKKWGIYEILRSCIEELIRCRLITGSSYEIFEANILKKLNTSLNGDNLVNEVIRNSNYLLELCIMCEGLSGRTLRKLPFLTSIRFIERESPNVHEFLSAMELVVISHKNDNKKFFDEKLFSKNGIY